MSNWKFVVNLPKDAVIELAKKCSSEGYYVEYSIPCNYIIPIEWVEQQIKELDTELDSLHSRFYSQGDSKEKNEALLKAVELSKRLDSYKTVLKEWEK